MRRVTEQEATLVLEAANETIRSFVGCFMNQEGLLETYARAHFTDCQELNLEPRRRQSGARCVCQLASMSKQSNRLCANV